MRWLSALTVGVILSGFAFLLLTGQYIQEGPVVVSVTHNHGLHAGDLFVIAGWVVGMAALGLLIRAPAGARPPLCRGRRSGRRRCRSLRSARGLPERSSGQCTAESTAAV